MRGSFNVYPLSREEHIFILSYLQRRNITSTSREPDLHTCFMNIKKNIITSRDQRYQRIQQTKKGLFHRMIESTLKAFI